MTNDKVPPMPPGQSTACYALEVLVCFFCSLSAAILCMPGIINQ